jgi:transcriptional antiterminator
MSKSIQTGNEKLVTIKEMSEKTGISIRAIQNYANKAKWTAKGKVTYLDERQVTLILEALKSSNNNQYDLARSLRGVETDMSIDLQIALAERKAKELWKTKAERLEAELEKTENVASWLIKGHQRLGEEVIEKFYGGELPYWAK